MPLWNLLVKDVRRCHHETKKIEQLYNDEYHKAIYSSQPPYTLLLTWRVATNLRLQTNQRKSRCSQNGPIH